MWLFGVTVSVVLVLIILQDAFETMVLPRRVMRQYRLTRYFYLAIWGPWRRLALMIPSGRRRQGLLSVFGPLSMLSLFACWVLCLIGAFTILHVSLSTPLSNGESNGWVNYFYFSGVTFFTLGYGDITPTEPLGRLLAVFETGVGFGFLAIVIGYMPVLYQAFSSREISISLLDARAGSPPTAGQLMLRTARRNDQAALDRLLQEWEVWAAGLLESHLSFPMLSFYRSQHDNQSWLAALTAVLDSCALLMAGVKAACPYQAELTFAMARHAAVDLGLVFGAPPVKAERQRFPPAAVAELRAKLADNGITLEDDGPFEQKLARLRAMYEPFVLALADRFLFALPTVLPEKPTVDNWQTSAWMRRVAGIGKLTSLPAGDDHFD